MKKRDWLSIKRYFYLLGENSEIGFGLKGKLPGLRRREIKDSFTGIISGGLDFSKIHEGRFDNGDCFVRKAKATAIKDKNGDPDFFLVIGFGLEG